MKPFFLYYMIFWGAACMAALLLSIKNRKDCILCRVEYWRFLRKPWRVATFLLATLAMTAVAPYTGDTTWDYSNALFMSILTYITAPWSIGTLYNAAKGRLPLSQTYVAICAWMFTASWSYDLYLVVRDGHYPATWFPNIFASSVLYVLAGLLWSLDWVEGRGVVFAFMEPAWPYGHSSHGFGKVMPYALVFMTAVSGFMLYFFWLQLC